jgi:uncharacterized UPF0160 family protein
MSYDLWFEKMLVFKCHAHLSIETLFLQKGTHYLHTVYAELYESEFSSFQENDSGWTILRKIEMMMMMTTIIHIRMRECLIGE